MLNVFKKNWFNICVVIVYTLLACLVYGIWSYSAWELWYVTFIIVLVLAGAGCTIGYLWIKGENQDKVNPTEEVVSKEEIKVE